MEYHEVLIGIVATRTITQDMECQIARVMRGGVFGKTQM